MDVRRAIHMAPQFLYMHWPIHDGDSNQFPGL